MMWDEFIKYFLATLSVIYGIPLLLGLICVLLGGAE